ncbi:MAG: YfhO family protein, partial [Chloroflexales bacterium]|nr:YfhO family protein [Chloroflexales bacterium]
LVALALAALAAVSALVTYDLWGGARVRWALGAPPDDLTRAIAAELFRWPNARPLLPAGAALVAALVVALSQWLSLRATTPTGEQSQQAPPTQAQPPQRPSVGASSAFSAPLRLFIAVLATGELWLFGYGYSGFTPPEAIYPPTPISAYLQNDPAPHRSIGPDGPFSPNRLMTQGLQSVDGLDDLVELRQYLFIRRGIESFNNVKRGLVLTPTARRLLDLMNARYLVTRQSVLDTTSEGAVLPLVLKHGNARIYRVDTALPRAFAATSALPATPATADDIVYSPEFNPRTQVVLEQLTPGFAAGPPAPITPVPIARYATGEVVLRPSLASPAVVVLADSYDSDWRVTVDGQEAPLLRANGIFRGVVVPAGQHEVVFRYRPALVYYGALAGIASLLACAAIGVLGHRRTQFA